MASLPPSIREDFERLKGDMLGAFPQEEMWSNLELYVQNIVRWSEKMSLVSRNDLSSIATKHLRQALSMVSIIADLPHQVVMDLGSGSGLPAIPIKIALSDSHFILIESRRKRANFLRDVVRVVGLEDIEVINRRIEDWEGWPGGVDLVTARAVASPDKMRDLVRGHLAPGGWILSPLDRKASYNVVKVWRVEEGGMGTTLGLYR